MEIIKKTIGEIETLIKTGKTPPSKEERYYNGSINWYTPGDLDKEKFLGKSNRTITEEAIAENKATILPSHTVVIGAIGDIGKLGITSTDSCTNQQITGIRTNDEVYFEYFYYWLKSNKQLLRNNAKNAILPILNNENIRSIKIQFPKNIDDQKRIAKVLSQCEGLMQKRKASIDLLDELLRSTFLEMFGDPVRNEKGWNIVPLSKFGTIDRGVSKHRPRNAPELLNGVHPLIQTGDVANAGTYILDYKQTYSNIGLKQSKKWPAGTLCITIAANIAKTGILTFDACFPDSIVGFVVDSKEATNLYVHHLFSFFQRILEKNAPSAAQKNINLEILRTFKVPQPLIEVQQEFDIIALKAEALKRQFKQSLQELENLYGSISQRAFKGELDLSKVEISDMEDSKKKDLEEVKEDLTEEQFENLLNSFEHTLPTDEVPANRGTDIRGITIRQYLGYPEYDEMTEGVEFQHMNKDYFYQFILTKGFVDRTFTLPELEQYARKYILRGTGFEFTYDNWKTILFRFIGAKQPIIEQVFDNDDKSIKLKLTDEAFKV